MEKYLAACRQADGIRKISSDCCQVIEGSNEGYFIEAFGLSYRFACIFCPKRIAQLFLDIVSMGPVDTITD
ncbi:MAG: hypothetical protein ACK6DA_01270 [Candidatus Kapaibacterium sp.]|jgi:hypothetical protein